MISIQHLLEHNAQTAVARERYPMRISSLEAILNGGLLSGGTLEFSGPRSVGKSGTVLAIVSALRIDGHSVVWVDAQRSLMPMNFAGNVPGHLWVIQPPNPKDALFCAEVMIRSQSFALVVIDGLSFPSSRQSIRLQRFARQSGTAMILLRDESSEKPTPSINERLGFSSHVSPAQDSLSQRHPFSWQVNVTHRGSHSQGLTHTLNVLEGAHLPARTLLRRPDRSTKQEPLSQDDHS